MMRDQGQPLRTIAVVGSGVVAWSAAIAFAKALPTARVGLVPAPQSLDALADLFPATFSGGAALLDRIGIDPDALDTAQAITPRYATHYADWNRSRDDWLVGEGDFAGIAGGAATYLLWLRAECSDPPAIHRLSPAVAAALADRSLPQDGDTASPFATAGDALRLDPERALPILTRIAATCNVVRFPAFARCDHAEDRVTGLYLDHDQALVADLYVDATGPAALLAAAPDTDRIDWSQALPCDRLLVAKADPNPTPIDHYRATEIGWRANWAGLRCLGYAANVTSETEARRTFDAYGPTARFIPIAPGRRTRAWVRNVLAIGDAAVRPGPLGQTGYAHALDQIALALDLLPGRDLEPLLIAEYNRRAALRADRLRDYCALLYLAQGRRAGAFWDALQQRIVPPDLARTLAHFSQRGHVPPVEEDSVLRDTWAATLIGLGIRPTAPDPSLLSIAPDVAANTLHRLADALETAAASLPSYSVSAA